MSGLRRLASALLLLALAGCGTLSSGPPPSATSDAVSRSIGPGGRFIALVGPRRQHDAPFLGVPGTNFYLLRSWLDTRTGERVTQLYVTDSYFGAERNFDAASDAQGQSLKFVPISKNEISCEQRCSYAEEFGAELPEAVLRANATGLVVSFSAKSDASLRIAVPGALVAAQLAALDAVRTTRPAAAQR